MLDIPAVAAIAHAAGVPLLIDNTFATPYLCRPIDFGADIVMHSLTKWIGGHGLVIGGVLVDGGRFDWRASGRHATLTEPYAGYHGLVFADEFGPAAFIMRARVEGLRDFGACLSPHNAAPSCCRRRDARACGWTGMSPIRWRSSPRCARNEAVAWVGHPSLARPSRPRAGGTAAAARAPARSSRSASSGGREAGRDSSRALKLASHLANVGDAKTLVIHPASPPISRWTPRSSPPPGVGEDLIRLSVGLEDAADIIADLEQALRAPSRRGRRAMQIDRRRTPSVFVATGGRAPDAGAPLVVFLHGAGMDHSVWALQSRWFAHHGRSVLAVDLPGHGGSEGPALASIEALADWTAGALERLGGGKALLVGHSMGSLVALEAAARRPDRVAAIGLIGTAATMPVHPTLLAAAAVKIRPRSPWSRSGGLGPEADARRQSRRRACGCSAAPSGC